jgi:uncharacterized delta-60 repeat protein
MILAAACNRPEGSAPDAAVLVETRAVSADVFGERGLVFVDQARFFATAVDPRGRIYAAGTVVSGKGSARAAIACFLPNGELAPDFGVRGFFELTRGEDPPNDAFYAIDIDARGLIVAAGKAGFGNHQKALLARVRPDGTLDDTFGDPKAKKKKRGFVVGSGEEFLDDAFASVPPEKARPEETFYAVAADERGRVIAAGMTGDRGENFRQTLVARFSDVGELDPAFFTVGYSLGNGGRKPWGAFAHDEFRALAILSDGSVFAAGFASDSEVARRALLVKYKANGERDERFGDADSRGFVLGPADELSAIAVSAETKILVAGSIGGRAMIIKRGATGGLEQSFTLPHPLAENAAIRALYRNGGRALLSDGRAIYGFDASGAIDRGFDARFAATATIAISDLRFDPKAEHLYSTGTIGGRTFVGRLLPKPR